MKSIGSLWRKSILICGCGRSGTTVFSSLIASFSRVEYCFDPPVVHWILALINDDNATALSKVLQVYLYKEAFQGALSARSLNMNEADQSWAGKFKSSHETSARQSRRWGGSLAEEAMGSHRLCIKVTDAVFKIRQIKEALPNIAIAGIVRNPIETILSVERQHWFHRQHSTDLDFFQTLPRDDKSSTGFSPLWVSSEDRDLWLSASDLEKAAIYYLRATNAALKNRDTITLVGYDHLVTQPDMVAQELADMLDLEPNEFTKKFIASIKRPDKRPPTALKNLNIRNSLRKQIEAVAIEVGQIKFLRPRMSHKNEIYTDE